MNINDFSDTTVTLPEKPASKNKRLIAVIIILLVLAAAAVGCWLIFRSRSADEQKKNEEIYRKYIEPIITNDKLIAEKPGPTGNKLYSYSPPEGGIGYYVTYALDDKVIQVQVLQSVVVDENFKPINDHFLNLLYQYHYNTDEVGYTLHITEISDPGDQTGKAEKYMYKQDRYADIKLDTELSLIEGTGRESRSDDDKPPLSEAEVKAMYEKYNDEITELRGKLYTLFGEENFKK